jgi:hypothetical protein
MKAKLTVYFYDKLFQVYLFLMKYGYSHKSESRVYDSYGMIDTLGHNCNNTRFTWSYSEELGCVWGIKLPFNYSIELVDYWEKEIRIEKTPKNKNEYDY